MRVIDADELREEILDDEDYIFDNDTVNHFLDLVDLSPTVDAEPVVRGHWVETQNRNFETGKWIETYVCSQCKRIIMLNEKENLNDFPYCHCGAKMDEEQEE